MPVCVSVTRCMCVLSKILCFKYLGLSAGGCLCDVSGSFCTCIFSLCVCLCVYLCRCDCNYLGVCVCVLVLWLGGAGWV